MSGKFGRQGRGTRPELRRAFVVGLSLSMALGGVPAYALDDTACVDRAGTDEAGWRIRVAGRRPRLGERGRDGRPRD